MPHNHQLIRIGLAVATACLLMGVWDRSRTGSSATGATPWPTNAGASRGAAGSSADQPQPTKASSRPILVTGTVTRHIEKSSPAGPLSGDETIVIDGSMVLSQQPNESGWLRGAAEGQVTFIGVQKVKYLGNFNATWNGSASMGDIFVRPASGQTKAKNPFTGPPPLVPWNGGAGTIALKCTGSGYAEYKRNRADLPEEWDTKLSFIIWVSSSGQIAIEVKDPKVKSGGLTASYREQ